MMLGATGIVLAARRPRPFATALVGANGAAALEGARPAHEAGLITSILVGRPKTVHALATAMGRDISGIRLVAADDDEAAAPVSLARAGEAAALMNMTLDARFKLLLITDAAVNVAPDHSTLCDIVLNVANLAHLLGTGCLRIAMISGTEEVTASMTSSERRLEAESKTRSPGEGPSLEHRHPDRQSGD